MGSRIGAATRLRKRQEMRTLAVEVHRYYTQHAQQAHVDHSKFLHVSGILFVRHKLAHCFLFSFELMAGQPTILDLVGSSDGLK